MEEIMIDVKINKPTYTIEEALIQMGYEYKGTFRYDYPYLGHKWYEKIRTELFEKDNQLFYFAGIPEWDDERISVARIGKVDNKKDKNPEINK